MSALVETLAFRPNAANNAGSTTNRTFGAWLDDAFLNVRDFGAIGDNVTDDTAAIQRCLDAAYGPYSNPNGWVNASLNKAVYFPAGVYKVTPSFSQTITNATNNGAGLVRLTMASTSGLAAGDIINVFGVTGVPNAVGSRAITNITGTTVDLIGVGFSGAFVAPASQNVTGTASGNLNSIGTHNVRLTFGSSISSVFTTNDLVTVAGVGGTVEANGTWTITVIDSTHIELNGSSFQNAWTSGGTVIRITRAVGQAIRVRAVLGGRIYGLSRESTQIQCTGTSYGGICFGTNGFGYGIIDGIHFQAPAKGICLDLNWQASDPLSQAQSTQSNTVRDCFLGGGDYGLPLGFAQQMCSETTVFNCYFSGNAVSGYSAQNQNACDNNIYGGNIAGCGVGVDAGVGAIPVISGVSFQGQVTRDISLNNTPTGGGDGYIICGCRDESTPNFVQANAAVSVGIIGCAHDGGTNGYFFDGNAPCAIIGCSSLHGNIIGNVEQLFLWGNNFGRSDYLDSLTGGIGPLRYRNLRQSVTSSPLALPRGYSGMCFDNFGAAGNIDVQLPVMNPGSGTIGVTFELYVAAAFEIKFTATNSWKIRDGATLSVANGKIASSTVGSYLTITAGPTTEWVVKSKNGTWTVT